MAYIDSVGVLTILSYYEPCEMTRTATWGFETYHEDIFHFLFVHFTQYAFEIIVTPTAYTHLTIITCKTQTLHNKLSLLGKA